MRITSVDATDLFTGPAGQPVQLIRVGLVNAGPAVVTDPAAAVTVTVRGRGVVSTSPGVVTGLRPGAEATAEVAVRTPGAARPGTALRCS